MALAGMPGGGLRLRSDSGAATWRRRFPEMAALDPATPVALAPAPGVVARSSARSSCARWRRASASGGARSAKSAWRGRWRRSTRHGCWRPCAATLPQAHIEILEYSRQPAPEGEIEFPRQRIARRGAADGALWTGSVRYAGNRRFLIWARVKVTVGVRRVAGDGRPPAGPAIAAGQVAGANARGIPGARRFCGLARRGDGQVAATGHPCRHRDPRSTNWSMPKDVLRGDTVRVEVRDGARAPGV